LNAGKWTTVKILVWVLINQRNVDITEYAGETVHKNLETKRSRAIR
jgi:hypothetical protein